MQPLQAPDRSVFTDSLSSAGELSASRWEPDTLVATPTYTDPYAAWLNEHLPARDSVADSAARSPVGRLRRIQPSKAPWEAIRVTLSPDGR